MKKFNIGDKVDFVNDYGVVFKNKIVIGLDESEEVTRYFIEPTDTHWISKKAYSLHLAGTYVPPSRDIELQNGTTAEFSHYDDWDRKIFLITIGEKTIKAVYLDEDSMYSISGDFGEPCSPLKEEYQPADNGKIKPFSIDNFMAEAI
jgi:hypothetical protein